MNKFERITRTIIIVLITIFITVIVNTSYILNRLDVDLEDTTTFLKYNLTSANEDFSSLKKIYSIIKNKYYKEVDYEKIEKAAIDGMLYGLGDEYSYYMTQEEYEEFEEETSGNYTGIGLYLMNNIDINKIEIISPIKGTPAYEAGLKTGDYIIAIDETEYVGSQINEATTKIKGGEAGTTVKLTIERNGERFNIDVERTAISVYKLEYKVLQNNIGYIEIKIFNEETTKDFVNAYNDLLNKNVKGIIIDVRDNPGGLLTQVVNVCGKLIPKDSIVVYTIDKEGNRKDYVAKEGKEKDIPIIVLTNNGSASASEILASALQDHGIATIIGNTTYGKGVVQTLIPTISNGYLKLTTSEYFTPNGNKINKVGVKPDVEISDDENTEEDEQLNKAIEVLNK